MSGSEYAPPSGSAWLAGWYATRLHAVPDGAVSISDGCIRSLCGAWVYRAPRTEWAARNLQRGIPRCKHCERIMSQNSVICLKTEAYQHHGDSLDGATKEASQ